MIKITRTHLALAACITLGSSLAWAQTSGTSGTPAASGSASASDSTTSGTQGSQTTPRAAGTVNGTDRNTLPGAVQGTGSPSTQSGTLGRDTMDSRTNNDRLSSDGSVDGTDGTSRTRQARRDRN